VSTNPPAILLGGGVTAVPVARSLGRAGVPVIALGKPGDPVRASRHTRVWVDVGGGEGVEDRWLEWLATAPPGGVVLPCEDNGLELVARHRATLEERGLVPIEADDEVLLAMLDKNSTYALAEQHGIPAPRTFPVLTPEELDRGADAIGFPCALKPVHSHLFARHYGLARKVIVGDDPEALVAQRSLARAVAAFAAAFALAVAAPLTALTPPTKVSDQPAATLASTKAPLAADDEDDPGD
jgi:predicted ATP-grasp superfamily ATP-dependent carboligase